MPSPRTSRLHAGLERMFPEKRIFIKSETDTRFVRLRPGVQLLASVFAFALIGWSIVASAVVLFDSIGSGQYRDQARRDQAIYQDRLNDLSAERDAQAREAAEARTRFNAALNQISSMQSELMASETQRRELETGIDVIQTTLRDVMAERENARLALAALEEKNREASDIIAEAALTPAQLEFLTDALTVTATERDMIRTAAAESLGEKAELEREILLMREQNDQIFRQIEEAMTISVDPLERMFRAAGVQPDTVLDQVRQGYSGVGGPLEPLEEPQAEEHSNAADIIRTNKILGQLDELNLYRIAADQIPFAHPVKASHRFTSPFGSRRDPITGGRRMHKGVDFAAPHGTDIFAPADGVVTFSGWQSGYGKVVKIRHAFGLETTFAHNTRLRVKKGQRVSRGQHIADMGSTGRSTGTHLHYEVRANGRPVNPMTYIKAAQNVF